MSSRISSIKCRLSLARRRSGFTLIECMFAMFLIALALPAVELGFANTTYSADLARRRTEAAGLAQSKLSELVSSENWQTSPTLQGDFGPNWRDYTWQANVSTWTGGTAGATITTGANTVPMEQLDVIVSWNGSNPKKSVTVSTLVYQRISSD
jgi:prepilin-type N-terminal cleavage/methylation domain-containing protein